MGQLGELFPGGKLRKEGDEDGGTGEPFALGSLDLDRGVLRLNPRPAAEQPDEKPGE